jgi:L,D-peptidoglycan transpeptidase YkuD (ErfK/YbiS/YcfS/YnhG family)
MAAGDAALKTDLIISAGGARFMGRRLACSIGRGGLIAAAAKREGDGATPQGTHAIVGMLYRADRMARPRPWAEPIGPADLWSDDIRDPAYNHMVRAPHGLSHEALHRADPLYDLILLTDWNWPISQPGLGSAIFLHRWRRPGAPTAGCVAFAAPDLLWIARHLHPRTQLIIR